MICAIRTFTSCNADTFGLDLEAETALIFPQGSRHFRLDAGWTGLASCVHLVLRWIACWWLLGCSHIIVRSIRGGHMHCYITC